MILDTPALSTAVNPIPNCDFWDSDRLRRAGGDRVDGGRNRLDGWWLLE